MPVTVPLGATAAALFSWALSTKTFTVFALAFTLVKETYATVLSNGPVTPVDFLQPDSKTKLPSAIIKYFLIILVGFLMINNQGFGL